MLVYQIWTTVSEIKLMYVCMYVVVCVLIVYNPVTVLAAT